MAPFILSFFFINSNLLLTIAPKKSSRLIEFLIVTLKAHLLIPLYVSDRAEFVSKRAMKSDQGLHHGLPTCTSYRNLGFFLVVSFLQGQLSSKFQKEIESCYVFEFLQLQSFDSSIAFILDLIIIYKKKLVSFSSHQSYSSIVSPATLVLPPVDTSLNTSPAHIPQSPHFHSKSSTALLSQTIPTSFPILRSFLPNKFLREAILVQFPLKIPCIFLRALAFAPLFPYRSISFTCRLSKSRCSGVKN